MKKLYCFDFDGTLTTKDTMFLFLKFYNPKKFRWQFIKHIPLFILLKIKLLNAENVKKSFISSIIKGESKENLDKISQQFFETYFPKIIRPNALDFLKKMERTNTDYFLVTASLDIWTRPFAEHFGMQLLATQGKFVNNRFSGDFSTKNCNGEEKVSRIKFAIEGKKYDKKIAFGDTSGDLPMLNWADEGHYQFFH